MTKVSVTGKYYTTTNLKVPVKNLREVGRRGEIGVIERVGRGRVIWGEFG